MAIYQLGKVIRMMREARQMTQDQLVEFYGANIEQKENTIKGATELQQKKESNEICSTQVLRRIENGTAKRIKGEVLFRLMEKIGVLPEQVYASIMVIEPWALNLKTGIYVHICRREYEEAVKLLQKLKPMMVSEYLRNEQYLMEIEATLEYRRKKIEAKEYLDILYSALGLTIPMSGGIDIVKWPFNWQELLILFSISEVYHSIKDKEKELRVLLLLKQNIEKKYMDSFYYTVWHTGCLMRLSQFMCIENQNGKAIEYCEIGIKECKKNRIIGKVHCLLYDNVWNKEQQINESIHLKDLPRLEEERAVIEKERVLCKKQLVQAYFLSKAQGDFINAERIKDFFEMHYPNDVKLLWEYE